MLTLKWLFLACFYVNFSYAAVTVVVNGSNHTIPQTNEKGWGANVTAWIQAISQYTLQNSGGTFTLTADVDTGATYGFKVPYIKPQTANPATAGLVRLAKTDVIDWRNNANGGNLPLGIDSSDRLTFNSAIIPTATTGSFQDSTFSIYDNGDATKLIAFQASGITTGNTRTITMGDSDVNLGAIANANLATMGANTVKANVTAGTAVPTNVSLLSTNTASAAVIRDGSGNFAAGTITASLTGLASLNTSYTANQYGVVASGSANVMTVVAPVASLYKVLSSGGTGANPTWNLEGISTPTTGSTFGNVAPGGSLSGLRVTAVGISAGAANTSGADNTFYGNAAGSLVTTGGSNTIIGSANGVATITTGARNTILGAGITPGNLAASDQVLIGNGVGTAALSSNGDVVIGSLAQGNNSNQSANPTLASVSIGYSANGNASYAANNSVTIGSFSAAGGTNDIIIGSGVQSNSADTVVFGHGGNTVSTNYVTTTAANQITFGTSTKALKDMFLGNGAVGIAAPANVSIQPTPVLAGTSNTAGASVTITGGNSTGTGVGGSIILQTAPAGSTGSTVNTLTTVGQVTSTGAWTWGATSTNPAHIMNGTLGMKGSSSGTMTLKPAAAVTDYTFTFPAAQGGAGTVLTNDGSGGGSWTTPASAPSSSDQMSNCSIAASVGASALTVALKDSAGSDPSGGSPCIIGFRNATATTGTYAAVSAVAATSVVVSNGSALGCTATASCVLYVYAINNAGTVVLGVVGGTTFDEGTVQSSTAEGGAGGADTLGTMYTTSAQASKAVRLLGRVTITPAAAFAWTNAASEVSNVPFVLAIITNWIAYTPTFSAGFGTVTATEVYYRRIGSDLEIKGTVTTGTVAGSIATMTLPPGLSTVAVTGIQSVGDWVKDIATGSAAKAGNLNVTAASASSLGFSLTDYTAATNPLVQQNGSTIFGNSQHLSFRAKVPIVGWSF